MTMENFRGIKFLNVCRSPVSGNSPDPQDIGKEGELTKQKNMKKRYFVLRKDNPARLEYYESKRRFQEGSQPRKKYELNKCYTISKVDSKSNSNVFALFINAECVTLIADSKELMQDWVFKLQQQKQIAPGSNSTVEHKFIWHVDIQERSLATSNGLVGPHIVCLNNKSLSLIRSDNEYTSRKEFKLHTIRQCGHVHEFFFIELGRSSSINSGLLWMKAEDTFIATNMHNIVISTMNQNTRNDLDFDHQRERTQSVCNPKSDINDIAPIRRVRADSTPSRSRTTSENVLFPASPTSPADHVARLCTRSTMANSTESFEKDRIRRTPDRDTNTADDKNEYVIMAPIVTANASANFYRDVPPSLYYPEEDRNEYVPPSSLVGFPRRCSHSAAFSSDVGSPSGCNASTPLGTSTPVSPLTAGSNTCWRSFPPQNQLPSPQASSGSHSAAHSRSSSLLDDCDDYLSMQPGVPPVSTPCTMSGNQHSVCSSATLTSNPYLEMGPGIDIETKRVSSTPTPIPLSPHDGDAYHDHSINSGNSSITSGTDSSDVPSGSSIGDPDDPEMRTIRTNSIGSRPEQYKRKNSAPMLVGSPISHSWSGTPGNHFRNICLSKAASRDGNHLFLIDYSDNKSSDNITDVKDKKGFWPFPGHRRQHSSSKSCEASNLASREKKLSEGDCSSHRPIDIPNSSQKDYCEMNFIGNSPRNLLHETSGYLPMHPPFSSLSGSSNALRLASHHDQPWGDMSSSLSSSGSQDGYVDMTQGSSPGSLVLASSSSSSTSLNILGTRHRRMGNVVNPMSSVDLPSPLEEDALDLEMSNEPVTSKKKGRKANKRPSLRGSNKKKKSDSGLLPTKGAEGDSESSKNKSPGPFSTLSNLLNRKSNNSKFPLSPQGNSKLNPFFGLAHGKEKELKEISFSPPQSTTLDKDSNIEVEQETKRAITPAEVISSKANTSHAILDNPSSAPLEKIIEAGSKSEAVLEKSPGASSQSSSQFRAKENRVSLCDMMNKVLKFDVDEAVVLVSSPSPSAQRTSLVAIEEDRNYVNMKPGSSNMSHTLTESSTISGSSSSKLQSPLSLSLKLQKPDGYSISGSKDTLSARSSSEDTVPLPHYELKSATDLDILTGPEQSHMGIIERSRSHSGPGASVSASYGRKLERGQGDGRASSACSSPISSSPPTSPTLGSVSSMSSLSEGGLSSASSTCTVVNVGMTRVPSQYNANNNNQSTAQPKMGKSIVPPQLDHTPEQSGAGTLLGKDFPSPAQASPCRCQASAEAAAESLSSSNLNRQSYGGSKSSLNYASLDLGTCKANENSPRSRRKSSSPVTDESSLWYSQIDFIKSEGLRNTSLARDSSRH